MTIVNMLQAKSNLSRLVQAVESGAEQEIIARGGKPAARLVPIASTRPGPRIGTAKGRFDTPTPDPVVEDAAAALLRGEAE